MSSDVLLIVLTENTWLYMGLAALLPDMNCVMLQFNARQVPKEIKHADRVIVVVDSLIFFRGDWQGFNDIKFQRPDTLVYWLTRKETGSVYPVKSHGERVLNQQQDILSLRNALLGRSRKTKPAIYVSPPNLTLAERYLLPFFCSGMDVTLLSRKTGKLVKTLYSHRKNILAKTGFRHLAFLQFVYKKNSGLPCLSEEVYNTKIHEVDMMEQ